MKNQTPLYGRKSTPPPKPESDQVRRMVAQGNVAYTASTWVSDRMYDRGYKIQQLNEALLNAWRAQG